MRLAGLLAAPVLLLAGVAPASPGSTASAERAWVVGVKGTPSFEVVTEAQAEALRGTPGLYVEPVIERHPLDAPTDDRYPEQWALENPGGSIRSTQGVKGADVRARAAWSVKTGAARVTVAVIDDGVLLNHPDLSGAIWQNADETLNGIDDDNNGYVDDVRGWDFVTGDNDPTPWNAESHGTHIAGIVAAERDGSGIVGVAYGVKIMPLRVCQQEVCNSTDVAAAIAYAHANGAQIINLSLGGPYAQLEDEAIKAATGSLFTVAAGNTARDNDVLGDYPCSLPHEHILCVAATDPADRLAAYSSYGRSRVDVAAPGTDILSTVARRSCVLLLCSIQPDHEYSSGTSMAAPVAAGVAALALSACTSCSTQGLRQILLHTVEPLASVRTAVRTGGRLDALEAVRMARAGGVFGATGGTLERGGRTRIRLYGAGFGPRDKLRMPVGVSIVRRQLQGGSLVLDLKATRSAGLGWRSITVDPVANAATRACAGCLLVVERGALTACPNPNGYTVVYGTNGADSLKGGNGREILCGLGGNDTFAAGAGDDIVFGGSGNDLLRGGKGRDRLVGQTGTDSCEAEPVDSRAGCERRV